MARPVVILTILSEGQGGRVVWEEQQNCQIDLWVREKSLIKWWFHKKMWKALFVRVYVWLRFYTWFGRIRYVSIQYSHRVIELYIGRCYCQCKDVFREHHDFSFVFNTARAGEDIHPKHRLVDIFSIIPDSSEDRKLPISGRISILNRTYFELSEGCFNEIRPLLKWSHYIHTYVYIKLVGGFNPCDKYWSTWIISPARGEHKKHAKPRPR